MIEKLKFDDMVLEMQRKKQDKEIRELQGESKSFLVNFMDKAER